MLVSGQIPLVGLFDWLQVLELNRRTVLVRMRRRGESGWLRLAGGRFAEAHCGALHGDRALLQLLTWVDAYFEMERSLDGGPGDVTRSNYDLMMAAVRQAPEAPPMDRRWRVSGDLVVMSAVELLQLAEFNRRRCVLRLHDDVEGEVRFDEGRIVGAEAGKASGAEAVYALLAARFGSFEVAPLDAKPAGHLAANVQELLVEGVRRADEARLVRGEPVPDPDPTVSQLLAELDAGRLSPLVRLAMARRYQPRGEATPVPVLLRLTEDPAPEVATAARASIDRLPAKVRRALAADEHCPPAIRERLAARLADGEPGEDDLPPDQEYPRGIHGRIRQLTMADKLYLAQRGTRNERLVLMRHPSRRVALAAFESSRTTEADVETIVRATSANAAVLEAIARDERYNSKYAVVQSLVLNPKTPAKAGIRLIPRLREGDLLRADRDVNLPEGLRAAIRKRLRALEVKRRF